MARAASAWKHANARGSMVFSAQSPLPGKELNLLFISSVSETFVTSTLIYALRCSLINLLL